MVGFARRILKTALRSSLERSMGYNQTMYYVYVIKSKHDDRLYIGFSTNLVNRLKTHNAGKSIHTAKYMPWVLVFYSAFKNIGAAKQFEKYLKSHSGKAFLYKRLIPVD